MSFGSWVPRCRRVGGLRRWPEPAAALLVGTVLGLLLHRCNVAPPSQPTTQAICSAAAGSRRDAAAAVVLPAGVSGFGGGEGAIRKRLVLVGVMTAQKFIDSRAAAVYNTWARSIPGDVVFFSSEGTRPSGRFRTVALPGVDDVYPPQKKSFMMLKYMHDHYAHQYDWFMRVDDDVYVKGDRLATFLHSINSSKPLFIGQSGQGSKDELGQLNLNRDENFCMGGPGMLLSAPALRKVAPHVSQCLQNLYTTHEDVEIGRCVRRFAGVQCTWSFEMPSLFYHNYGYKDQSAPSFPVVLPDKHVEPAITLHPVKTIESMHRVHNDVLSRRCRLLRHRAVLLAREMRASAAFSAVTRRSSSSSVAHHAEQHRRSAATSAAVVAALQRPWEAFGSRDLYSLAPGTPRRGLPKPLQPFLKSVQWQAMEILGKYAEHRGGGSSTQLTQLHRGFWLAPVAGDTDVRVMLDVQLSYQRGSSRRSVRRQLFIRVPLGEGEIRVVSDPLQVAGRDFNRAGNASQTAEGAGTWSGYVRDKLSDLAGSVAKGFLEPGLVQHQAPDSSHWADLVMILPLSGRPAQLSRFLQNFENVCIRAEESGTQRIRVRLIIVAFAAGEPEYDRLLQDRILQLQHSHAAHPSSNGRVDVLHADGRFSRGRALQLGASHCASSDLLLFIDVDIEFDAESLRRAVAGARRGVRAYFPIVFSQYSSEVVCGSDRCSTGDRSDAAGFFRHYGFGIACIYKQDLDYSGGFNLTIEGWGKEDVDVYAAVGHSGLEIFRAADHALVHVYHPMACSSSELGTEQMRMCRGSMTSQLASVRTLLEMLEGSYRQKTNDSCCRTVLPSSSSGP